MKKHYFVFFVLFLVFLDQLLKVWVFNNQFVIDPYSPSYVTGWWWEGVPFFKITYLENPGMSFGLLSDSGETTKFFLTFFRLFAVFFMFFYAFYKYKKHSFFSLFLFSLLIAGAIGNCIDSVFYDCFELNTKSVGGGLFSGNVIDMFRLSFFPPVFNLADSYISVGCFLGVVFYKKL